MESFLLVIHVLLALALIALVLLQHGKGAEVGASFGSGASSTVFGAQGSASFLTKITTIIAVIFFASSLALAYISAQPQQDRSLIDNLPTAEELEKAKADDAAKTIPLKIMPVNPEDAALIEETAPADVPAIEEE